jgi:hypothetical protein
MRKEIDEWVCAEITIFKEERFVKMILPLQVSVNSLNLVLPENLTAQYAHSNEDQKRPHQRKSGKQTRATQVVVGRHSQKPSFLHIKQHIQNNDHESVGFFPSTSCCHVARPMSSWFHGGVSHAHAHTPLLFHHFFFRGSESGGIHDESLGTSLSLVLQQTGDTSPLDERTDGRDDWCHG